MTNRKDPTAQMVEFIVNYLLYRKCSGEKESNRGYESGFGPPTRLSVFFLGCKLKATMISSIAITLVAMLESLKTTCISFQKTGVVLTPTLEGK